MRNCEENSNMPVAKSRPYSVSGDMGIAHRTVGVGKDFLSLLVAHKPRSCLTVLTMLNG